MGFEIFFNKTVTLYNRYYDKKEDAEKWYCTVLHDVRLEITKGANIVKSGIREADGARLSIMTNTDFEKDYVEPKKWLALTDEEREASFTFNSSQDFFVKGNTSEIEIKESNFFEYMRANYDDVYKITTVDNYDNILPHIEVGGV